MNAPRRALGWHLAGLLGLALLLQGCGAAGGQPAVQYFRGTLPALDTVQFVTPTVGFLAGQGIVLATADGGAKWTRVYKGQATIRAIDFVSRTKGWVLTTTGSVLSWSGGTKWQSVARSLGPAAAIHLASDGTAVILTEKGVLYRTQRAGGAWQRESLTGVSAISFGGERTGWAVTGDGTTTPQIWRTEDAGKTWTASFTPTLGQPQGWTATLASSGGTAWLLLTSAYGQVEHQPFVAFVSSDLGSTWHEALAAPLFVSQGMYASAPASLYGLQAGPFAVLGQRGYFLSWAPGTPSDLLAVTVTADGGRTWSQRPLQKMQASETPDFFQPLDISLSAPETLWIVGSRSGRGRILVSHDGGAHWTVSPL